MKSFELKLVLFLHRVLEFSRLKYFFFWGIIFSEDSWQIGKEKIAGSGSKLWLSEVSLKELISTTEDRKGILHFAFINEKKFFRRGLPAINLFYIYIPFYSICKPGNYSRSSDMVLNATC